MNTLSKTIKTYIFYATSAFGASLAIKANIGVSSFSSMNVAISNAAEIKIGTITIAINLLFLLTYAFLTHFRKIKTYFVQTATIFMFGSLINFYTYQLLDTVNVSDYIVKIAFISFGTIISGLSIGMIVRYDVITLPVEGSCLELSKLTKHSFSKLRYAIDIFSIIISIVISFGYELPLYVREGTLISMILFTGSIALIQKRSPVTI